MHATSRLPAWLALGLLSVLGGCAWVPKSQLTAVESQNRALTEQNRAQLAEIENLKSHSRQIEDQLILAEEELALLEQRYGLGRGRMANRSPSAMPAALSERLIDLSERFPSLHFDPATGISKLDTDVLFDPGEATMKREARELLDEFAAVLRSPAASQLRIMVVGHTDDKQIARKGTRERFATNWHLSTARALAVSEHLRHLGVSEERMGVAGFGEHQPVLPNSTAETRRHNRRVEIYVMGPDTPVVGWTDSMRTVR